MANDPVLHRLLTLEEYDQSASSVVSRTISEPTTTAEGPETKQDPNSERPEFSASATLGNIVQEIGHALIDELASRIAAQVEAIVAAREADE